MHEAYRNQVLEEYRLLPLLSLAEEKRKQEAIIAEETAIWKSTNLALPVIGLIFGIIFSIVLIGIPLLVLSIQAIVIKSRTRGRANIAINKAKIRVEILDSLIAKAKRGEDPIEVEVVG